MAREIQYDCTVCTVQYYLIPNTIPGLDRRDADGETRAAGAAGKHLLDTVLYTESKLFFSSLGGRSQSVFLMVFRC